MAEIDPSRIKWDEQPSPDPSRIKWDDESPSMGSRANAGFGGINRGISQILGLPVDTAENVLNLGRAGIGAALIAAGKPDLAPSIRTGTPLGSQWIAQQLERLGISASNPNPEDAPSQMLFRAGTIAPTAAIPGASARQTAASAAGAAVGEQVGGDVGAMTGALLPAVGTAAYRGATSAAPKAQNTQKAETLAAAREEGYRFPPAETNPSVTNKLLEGWAGKLTTRQKASEHNAEVTTNIAKRAIGIKADEPLTDGAISAVRDRAYTSYDAIKRQPGAFEADRKLANDIASLDAAVARAAKEYPDLVKNPGIDDLKAALSSKETHNPEALVELIKNLRFQAKQNYRGAMGAQKPAEQVALADAQRKAAGFLEDFIERKLPNPSLVKDFKEARTTIAKTHDVESAFNEGSGLVNARVFASLMDKGRPLGGGLETIAKTYKAFPHAMKTPETIGSQPFFSPLDVGAGAMVGGGGAPSLAALLVGRPLIRSAIMSRPYQAAFGSPSATGPVTPESALAALLRGYISMPMTQAEPER